jgi:hypothetical protein
MHGCFHWWIQASCPSKLQVMSLISKRACKHRHSQVQPPRVGPWDFYHRTRYLVLDKHHQTVVSLCCRLHLLASHPWHTHTKITACHQTIVCTEHEEVNCSYPFILEVARIPACNRILTEVAGFREWLKYNKDRALVEQTTQSDAYVHDSS